MSHIPFWVERGYLPFEIRDDGSYLFPLGKPKKENIVSVDSGFFVLGTNSNKILSKEMPFTVHNGRKIDVRIKPSFVELYNGEKVLTNVNPICEFEGLKYSPIQDKESSLAPFFYVEEGNIFVGVAPMDLMEIHGYKKIFFAYEFGDSYNKNRPIIYASPEVVDTLCTYVKVNPEKDAYQEMLVKLNGDEHLYIFNPKGTAISLCASQSLEHFFSKHNLKSSGDVLRFRTVRVPHWSSLREGYDAVKTMSMQPVEFSVIDKDDVSFKICNKLYISSTSTVAFCPIHTIEHPLILGPAHAMALGLSLCLCKNQLLKGWDCICAQKNNLCRSDNKFGYHEYPLINRHLNSRYKVGIEVEKLGAMPRKVRDTFNETGCAVSSDASVDWELVSPVWPLDREHKEFLSGELEKIEPFLDARHAPRCGGHIHVSDAETPSVSKLWESIEGYLPLLLALYWHRACNSNYAERTSKNALATGRAGRAAIAIRSNTIEFRIFSAVKNKANLEWRLELLRRILENRSREESEVMSYVMDETHPIGEHILSLAQFRNPKNYKQLIERMVAAIQYTTDDQIAKKCVSGMGESVKHASCEPSQIVPESIAIPAEFDSII